VTDGGWGSVFALLFIVMVAVTSWIVWYSKRAMRSHKNQIEDMVRELKESTDKDSSDED
jgi:hypothetical protein